MRAGEGDDPPLVLHELAAPTRADVEAVASRTAARIEAILRRARDRRRRAGAEVRGVNVHAKQTVHGNVRRALERLACTVMRPPLSQERLEKRDDGCYELELKST